MFTPTAWKTDAQKVLDFKAFANRLLDPEDLGLAVTSEVRDLVRELIGLPKVES